MSDKTAARTAREAQSAKLAREEHLKLYVNLKKTRLFDERCRKLFKAGRLPGTYFAQVGQEAIGVGSCTFLRHEDWVVPAHRNLSAHIAKGAPLRDLLAQVYAKAPSPDRGKSHPCHWGYPKEHTLIIASTIAAHAVVGTGIALAFQLRKQDHVVLSYVGEGASANGAYHEALNFAAIRKLPIVFTIENNLWAESVPTHLSAALERFSDRGKGHGVPGVTIDGNDVLAVHDTFHTAISKARAGGGPTLIEALTYRWYGHSEIDPANYRSNEEVARWKSQDPIPRFEAYLTDRRILTLADLAKVEAEINLEIEDAIEYAESAPKPKAKEALEDVYSFSPNHDRSGGA